MSSNKQKQSPLPLMRPPFLSNEDDITFLDEKNEKVSARNLKNLGAATVLLLVCCGILYYIVDWPSTELFKKDIRVTESTPYSSRELNSRKSAPKPYWSECLEDIPLPDNRKHIVPPPAGSVTLVCCNTTKGTLNIEVHPTWAPIGAERFLHMVNSGFFSTKVGLFRALQGFLVQFGLAGDPEVHKLYHSYGNLKDDPSWLPLGPPGREINGIKRYQKGYLGYAGAGDNSRGTQLIMAFEDNLYLGGGCPWEVPFGQLVGDVAFQTLSKIYTGYGEKPSQGKIMNRGVAYLEEEFPLMDYMNKCVVVKSNVPWEYKPPT